MKRHALFIGIDRYEDDQIRSLGCAEEDAVQLHGFFQHRVGFDATRILLSPSAETVLEVVEALTDDLSAGDLFLCFFAGHGVTHERRHLLLCPKARHHRLSFLNQVVPVDLLQQETARAGLHRVFILDACRSELLNARQAGSSGFSGAAILRDVVAQPAGRAAAGSLTILCSCEDGGQAGEIPQLRGGIFRLALQETLAAAAQEGRSLAVGENLVSAVERRMTRLAETHGIGRRQRPWFQKVGEAPLLLADRAASPITDPPSQSEADAKREAEDKSWVAAKAAATAELERFADQLATAFNSTPESEVQGGSRHDVHATKANPWENSLGMRFVPVSGTQVLFSVWETRVQDYAAYATANPGVNARWKKPGFSQSDIHPVVNVSWHDANAFCAWLTTKEREEGKISADARYRLPGDWEWSVAVGLNEPRAGTPKEKDGKIKGVYPWGTEWPPPHGAGNYGRGGVEHFFISVLGFEDDFPRTSPVGSFAENQHGLYDLGGNVWEWCEDAMRFLFAINGRVLRGGSWYNDAPEALLSSGRHSLPTSYLGSTFGFRCVLVGVSSR